MAEWFPRVGASFVGLHHRLILVIPVLSETAIFSVDVTKPSTDLFNIFDNILPRPHAQSIQSEISK